MANITVPGMPSATSVSYDDIFHLIQSGIDKSSSIQLLMNSLTETVTLLDGENISVTSKNTIISCDTTTADTSISLNSGSFAGQTVSVINTGTNKLTLTGGNGIYSNNVYITSNTGGWHGEWSGSEWISINEITAEYDDGDYKVKLYSNGDFIITGQTVSIATSTWETISLPITTTDTEYTPMLIFSSGGQGDVSIRSKTTTNFEARQTSGSSGYMDVIITGTKYASI